MNNQLIPQKFKDGFKVQDISRGPKFMAIDVTNKCNFRCLHCFNSSGDENCYNFDDELTDVELLKLVEKIIKLGVSQVCLCGGEPTLRIELVYKMVDMLSREKITVNMVSNGYLMTKEKARKLKKAGINSVQISVDGLGEVHNRFRNMPQAFERAVRAIRFLKEENIQVMVSCCPNNLNYRCLETYFQYIYEMGVDKIRMMPFLPLGRGDSVGKSIILNDSQLFDVARRISKWNMDNPKLEVEWGDPINHLHNILLYRKKKPGLLSVCSNGDVKMTPYLDHVLGNVRRDSLETIWEVGLGEKVNDPLFIKRLQRLKGIYDLNSTEV